MPPVVICEWESITHWKVHNQIYAETKPLNHHILFYIDISPILSCPSMSSHMIDSDLAVSHTHCLHHWLRQVPLPTVQMNRNECGLGCQETVEAKSHDFIQHFSQQQQIVHSMIHKITISKSPDQVYNS